MIRLLPFLITGYLITSPAMLFAQGAASGCDDELSHQFDFWLGEWNVYTTAGLAGTNSVTSLLDGCVLQEEWHGTGGSSGTSLNFYNPSTKQWQQFWVWQNGTTLETFGGYADGKMILEGSSTGPNGVSVMNRITWFDNPDGTVRQLWEQSSDGVTWTPSFDGMYKKE